MEDNRRKSKYDASAYKLGSLCRRNHDYEGSGKSLRHIKWGHCLECYRLKVVKANSSPLSKDRQKRYRERNGRRELTSEQKQRKAARQKYRFSKGLTDEQKRNRAILQYRYKVRRKQSDEVFAVVERLRDRVRQAIKRYGRGYKVGVSKDYGINYEAIAKHLGPCPGDRKDYEIDHIKPLSSFDLTDKEQVKLAFAPDNHQWLLAAENRAKGDRY